MFNKRIIIFLALVFVLLSCASYGHAQDGKIEYIRVAIAKDVKSITMSIRGKYTLSNIDQGRILLEGRRLKKTEITTSPNGVQIGDEFYFGKHLRFQVRKDFSIYVNDKRKRYRGSLDILKNTDNTLLAVNRLGIEDYVKGVLYHEVPHHWPLTAIKAQAVATRTYAIYQAIERKSLPFDVTSDIYSQVYGGRSAERYRSNIAANRTRGEVLTYQGKIIPAYFHSTCAGHTENAFELWEHNLEPLKGVKCRFCKKAPLYRWKKNFRSKDVQDQLNENGYNFGLIKDIDIIKRTDSGRVKTLKITTRDGLSKTVPAVKFREILGPNILKSSKYEIKMQGYYFDVLGQGWGHGVGMCQWGNHYMAKERYKYDAILSHYYPQANIMDYFE